MDVLAQFISISLQSMSCRNLSLEVLDTDPGSKEHYGKYSKRGESGLRL